MIGEQFRKKLLECKTSDQITDLVLDSATKPTDFAPVTVPVPGIPGAKITYDVMKGYISADDYPVPVDAVTADTLAKRWGMHLPTSKMVDQITEESARTGGIVKVDPLSATGVDLPGLKLSPEEIVQRHISNPRLIDRHNELVRQYVKEKGISPESIVIGDQKILIAPEPGKEGFTHFKGFLKDIKHGPDGKPILSFYQSGLSASPHFSKGHLEYPLKGKLVKDEMTVTLPTGETKTLNFAEAMKIPELAAVLTNSPISTYSKSKTDDPKYQYSPSKSGEKPKLESLPAKKPSELTEGAGSATVPSDKPKDTWEEIKETAGNVWEKTKGFFSNVFSEADEFELLARSELQKTKLVKMAVKRELIDRLSLKK